MSNFNPDKNAAFTLIELLLGITIFSVIAVSVYLTFANGLRINRRSQNFEGLYREARWLLETIALDIENAVDYRVIDKDSGEESSGFVTGASRLSFLIPTDDGLKGIRYYLKSPEESRVYKTIIGRRTKKNVDITINSQQKNVKNMLLIREDVPFYKFANDIKADEEEAEIISQYVKEGSLKFFYAEGDKELKKNLTWKSSWLEVYPPLGVRVELILVNPKDDQQPLPIKRDIFFPTGYWRQGSGEGAQEGNSEKNSQLQPDIQQYRPPQ